MLSVSASAFIRCSFPAMCSDSLGESLRDGAQTQQERASFNLDGGWYHGHAQFFFSFQDLLFGADIVVPCVK